MSKLIIMAAIALFVVIPMLSAARQAAAGPPLNRAVVNGHHVQPSASTMIPTRDVDAADARQLDELYRLQTGADPAAPDAKSRQ